MGNGVNHNLGACPIINHATKKTEAKKTTFKIKGSRNKQLQTAQAVWHTLKQQ